MESAWIAFWSALTGGAIAGAVAIVTQLIAARHARRLAKEARDHETVIAQQAAQTAERAQNRAERHAASEKFLVALARAVDEVRAQWASIANLTESRFTAADLLVPNAVTACKEASVSVVLLGPKSVAAEADAVVAALADLVEKRGPSLPDVEEARQRFVLAVRDSFGA